MTVDRPASGPEASVDADAFKGFEVAGWERQAPTYDSFIGRLTSQFVDPLLDAAGVGTEMRVLDLATGPGYAAARAAERGATVVGGWISHRRWSGSPGNCIPPWTSERQMQKRSPSRTAQSTPRSATSWSPIWDVMPG
jgi:hypothetical protein